MHDIVEIFINIYDQVDLKIFGSVKLKISVTYQTTVGSYQNLRSTLHTHIHVFPCLFLWIVLGESPYFFNLAQTVHIYDHVASGTTIFTVSANDDDYDYAGVTLSLPTSSSYFTITGSEH